MEKKKLAIDKAEAASEAWKSVDVIWYDHVCWVYPAQFISNFANKAFALLKLFTFQGKNKLPEFPHFNAHHHLQWFCNDVPVIQHYNPTCGGWVNISTAFLFTINEGKPIIL